MLFQPSDSPGLPNSPFQMTAAFLNGELNTLPLFSANFAADLPLENVKCSFSASFFRLGSHILHK